MADISALGLRPSDDMDLSTMDGMRSAIKALFDSNIKMMKELENMLQTLDSSNITEIDANTVNVKNLTAGAIKTGELVVGTNVGLGSAVDSGDVTTIVGGMITTNYVNALGITAQSVAAENITGSIISGKTIVGGSVEMTGSSSRVKLMDNGGIAQVQFKDSAGNTKATMEYNASSGLMAITSNGPAMIIDSPGAVILHSNSSIQLNGSQISVFGSTPQSKHSVTYMTDPQVASYTAGDTYTANEKNMLNAIKDDIVFSKGKINGLISHLAEYGWWSAS